MPAGDAFDATLQAQKVAVGDPSYRRSHLMYENLEGEWKVGWSCGKLFDRILS
jgi:hypothetical protein